MSFHLLSPSTSQTIQDLAQKATQANKEHQYTLKVYTERLEAELEAVDKLLVSSCRIMEQQLLTNLTGSCRSFRS